MQPDAGPPQVGLAPSGGSDPHEVGERGGKVSPLGRPEVKHGPLGGQGATRSGRAWGLG